MRNSLTSWQKFVKKYYHYIANGSKHRTIMKRLSKMYKMNKTKRRAIRQREPIENRIISYMPSDHEVVWENYNGQKHNVGAPALLNFYPTGRLNQEEWYLNDKLSRPTLFIPRRILPAVVSYLDEEQSRVYEETFFFEVEYEDGEKDTYAHTITYFDEDANELEEPEESFQDADGYDIEIDVFEEAVGEEWRDELMKARDIPRDSFPRLYVDYVEWRNSNGEPHRTDAPAFLQFYTDSGRRLRQEKWVLDGKLSRPNNLPAIVAYMNNPENDISSEWWVFNPIDGTANEQGFLVRYYNTQGQIETEKYMNSEYDEMDSQIWRERYGTPSSIVSTVPSNQGLSNIHIEPTNPTPEDSPSEETYYRGSKRVKSRKWLGGGRNNNYPYYVMYADNDEHTVLREDWFFRHSIYIGEAERRYDMTGNINKEQYEIVNRGEAYPDLKTFLEVFENPVINSERFGRYDYTIGDFTFSTSPQRQEVCPAEDINSIREPKQTKEVSKCSTIFKIDKPLGAYPMGDILDKLYQDCNFMEDADIDYAYVNTTTKHLQKKLPIPSLTRVSTLTNNEIKDALPISDIFSSFIPQVQDEAGKFIVTYKDSPAVDYGGASRQFIDNIMESISFTLFDKLYMEDQPFVEIFDTMSEDDKRKANTEASKPRYFISKKSDDEISQMMKVSSSDVPKVYYLAGNMFAYAAINQIPFKFCLSRILLKKLLNDNQEVSEEERMAAYILDTGKNLSMNINIIFKYGEDEDFIKSYMEDLENQLKKTSSDAYNVDKQRLNNFVNGFKKVGDILRQRNITINELNAMICKTEITREEMQKFVNKVVFSGFRNTDLIQRVKETILNIEDYSQLLKWWSGTSVILDKKYEVQLMRSEDLFFNAHTCFFRFDVSSQIINSPNFLKEFNTEIKNVKLTTI